MAALVCDIRRRALRAATPRRSFHACHPSRSRAGLQQEFLATLSARVRVESGRFWILALNSVRTHAICG